MVKCGGYDLPRVIVLDADASATERLAAAELRAHLAIIGSQAVEADSASGPALFVGATYLSAQGRSALDKVRDDGYVLYRQGDSVYVAGKEPSGTLFGCYSYLESLGIRWPEPGAAAEVTGRTWELASDPEDGLDNPDFAVRGNNCYYPVGADDFTLTLETVEWLTRQRYNLHSFLRGDVPALTNFDDNWYRLADFVHERGLAFVLGTHTSWSGLLMYEDKDLFEKHPEYFPLRDGRRQASGPFSPSLPADAYGPDCIGSEIGSGISVCVSNPEVIDLITKHLRTFLDAHGEIDVMGMWPPDTKWEGCDCTDCRKLVAPERMWSMVAHHDRQWRVTSDLAIHLVGQVAAGIRQTHPDVRILTWGWCTCEPGPQNVTPAATIQFDEFYTPCFTHAIDSPNCLHHHIHPQAWRDWAAVDNVDLGWIHTGAAWAMTAAEFPHAWLIKKNIEFLRTLGGKAVTYNLEIGGKEDGSGRTDITGHYMFGACGINYYVLGRAGWDADIPLTELYADFAAGRFGAAAAGAMTAYYCQIIEKYENWQHSQPLPDFSDVWGSSEVRCRAPWEVAVDIFDPDMIRRAHELLDEAENLAQTPAQQGRVQLERRVFEHTMLLRQVFHLHLARQKLELIEDTERSQDLRNKQLKILEQARNVDLPKHFDPHFFDNLGWL
jgi:hypothetical protein